MSGVSERPGALFGNPVFPFLGIALLALAATGLHTAGTEWVLVVAAGAGVAVTAVLAAVMPWSTLPWWALLVLPIACDVLIGLLRQAGGGNTSGYSPLAILPVVWVGLALRGWAVGAIAACTAALFGLPIWIVGAPLYPATGVRGVVLWTIVSVAVGLGANHVVRGQRRLAALANRRAGELDRLVRTQAAIAADMNPEAAMATVVNAALTLLPAEGAVVLVPEGDELTVRALAGSAAPHLGLRLPRQRWDTLESLPVGQVLICNDPEHDDRIDRIACRRIEARSLILAPIVHEGDSVGALLAYAPAPEAFAEPEARVLELLANMLASALARGQLIQRLSEQAITDELTGVLNRRAWNQQLQLATARARRTGNPLSVALLDLDGFKQVNDRQGHAAGDALLVAAANRWSAVLRHGELLGRIGGDEFAVLMENTDPDAAHQAANRLQHALPTHCSTSTGTATWNRHENTTSLLARADTQMYEHKRTRTTTARAA